MAEFRQATWRYKDKVLEPTVFELSKKGREGHKPPEPIKKARELVEEVIAMIPERMRRKKPPNLPELSEVEVVRHYTRLAQMNYCVDLGFYPLGSCTMKYNPKICEEIASVPEVAYVHPNQDEETVQGALEILYETERMLAEILGMSRVTLQPAAGAQGELTGMAMARRYFEDLEEDRRDVLIPDSAHGTNPASARMCGFNVVTIPSNEEGLVDLDALEAIIGEQVACLMLTNPNTLGLFERDILKISRIVHEYGALLYLDGANMNALLGVVKPGDMGFDIAHVNLHKTFSTPHGGGGPGAGPVGVNERLVEYLPVPTVEYDEEKQKYYLNYNKPKTIGKVRSFYGNFTVILKAYIYLKMIGREGLRRVAEVAVLNANYLAKRIEKIKGFSLPYKGLYKHEFVVSATQLKKDAGVTALDIAKRILDYGIHPPTIYFPLIVPEALMIEPTETENLDTLRRFVEVMEKISEEAYTKPDVLKRAPHNTSVRRVDEAKAAKEQILTWKMYLEGKAAMEH
ncbi:MAG: aminomethyl-transferring glycine dehydrogenase subunit GcvPB [Candidatus Freyarchaeota archaeon]|nr:aminomethyl-transferring glycine dehydrogenase subunit GcvPB [Candidatus Freyrarchaeum guaymaensis]